MNVIVVGVDGTEQSLLALRAALGEAESHGAELHVVHVLDFTPAVLHLADDVVVNTADVAAVQRDQTWRVVDESIGSPTVNIVRINLEGHPGEALATYADDNNADLLVVGTRGRGRMKSILLGSTSRRALDLTRCNVLVVKPSPTT